MSSRYPSAEPFRNLRMREAAGMGMVITLHCNACRRTAHYWAADLVRVLGDHQVHVAPWPCGKCKNTDFLRVTWEVPNAAKLGGLTVRRPVRKIEKWIWRNEKA